MYFLIFILFFWANINETNSQSYIDDTFLPSITSQDSIFSIKALENDFRYLLQNSSLHRTKYSICVYSLDQKKVLIGINENLSLTPASLTKLFTTFNSLKNFGPDYNITTQLFSQDNNIKDGVINGNLILKGGGDALFSKDDLDTLLVYLKKYKINEIQGNFYIDLSLFDELDDRFEYSGDDDRVVNLSPITPLSISRASNNRAISIMKKSLHNSGIELRGEIEECNDIDESQMTKLIEFQRPLIDLINITNKRSDNYVAEHLFKLNGASNDFSDNDWESSIELLYRTADSLDIPIGSNEIYDGSGLSRRNKISAYSLVSLLSEIYNSDLKNDFMKSLSIAGRDGTLKARMIDSHSENNLRAKTGTLRDASGLSGYVRTLDGENLAFAIIFNGNLNRKYKQLEDEMAKLLGGFFYFNYVN